MNTSWVQLFNRKVLNLAHTDCWNIAQDDDLLPQQTPAGWNWYRTSSFARFHCSTCSNGWASARALILFNMRLRNGTGDVKVRFFKQQCRRNHDEEANFVEPVFSEENIKQVLDRLMTKIRQRCYQEDIGERKAFLERDCNLDGPHETRHCEACRVGICSQAV
ncbi:receptor-transporting protein 3-like [Carcharodon carcharias]|uniref:receptor-transporting protein 3-like n=1 Tax=Carcharodon carcharias TaxID=13397 RepID=UPI001B7D9DCB|nr:receptor-transporting protein 3-like [Carcharodon carcharias]